MKGKERQGKKRKEKKRKERKGSQCFHQQREEVQEEAISPLFWTT
jgi:hypothetical protein